MELSNGFSVLDINEINTYDTSCDELEINEASKSNKLNRSNYRKVITAATGIFVTKASTTKLRITNLEIDGNMRRETLRSLSYMNPHISSLHNSVSPFSSNSNLPQN